MAALIASHDRAANESLQKNIKRCPRVKDHSVLLEGTERPPSVPFKGFSRAWNNNGSKDFLQTTNNFSIKLGTLSMATPQ